MVFHTLGLFSLSQSDFNVEKRVVCRFGMKIANIEAVLKVSYWMCY